jgi:hypothetical protein
MVVDHVHGSAVSVGVRYVVRGVVVTTYLALCGKALGEHESAVAASHNLECLSRHIMVFALCFSFEMNSSTHGTSLYYEIVS